MDTITSKIRQENVDLPVGQIEKGNYEVLLRIPGAYTNLDQIRDTVVAFRNGAPILLKEIASIEDTFRKITRVVRINDTPGTRIAINKQSGKNTVAVAEGVKAELARIQEDIPQIQLVITTDSAQYIQRAISNVGSSALYGGFLAVLVLLFFLGNVRSTLIIGVAIPISIIGTFALIYFGGFTLNIMTLGGLALGVGMMVDNGIVVLENIYRLHEGGMPIREASVLGSRKSLGHHRQHPDDRRRFHAHGFYPGDVRHHVQATGLRRQLLPDRLPVRRPDPGPDALQPVLESGTRRARKRPGLPRQVVRMTRGVVEKLERYRRLLEYSLNHKTLILGIAGGSFWS